MDIPHTNIDAVFKESLTLFKDKTLDFLGITNIPPITELLGAEGIQIELKWDIGDLVFGTSDRCGLNLEEEVDLSHDDLLRFCGYNTGLSRLHKREFVTVIFVKNPTNLTGVETEQLSFRPIIVQCSKIDADAILARLKRAVAENRPINELEAIFLPLFHSENFTPTQLFVESKKQITAMQADTKHKQKVMALLLTLAGKVADKEQLDAVAEEVKNMGNVIIEYFEERGEKRRQEEIAEKLLALGIDTMDIIEATGVSPERIREMRKAAV